MSRNKGSTQSIFARRSGKIFLQFLSIPYAQFSKYFVLDPPDLSGNKTNQRGNFLGHILNVILPDCVAHIHYSSLTLRHFNFTLTILEATGEARGGSGPIILISGKKQDFGQATLAVR